MNFFIPTILLFAFSIFNLLGIKKNLIINEIAFFLIGVVIYLIVKKIGRNFFRLNIKTIYFAFLLSLILTFVVGLEAKGSKRWIDFIFFKLQTSELFKPFFILFLAEFFSVSSQKIDSLSYFFKSLIYFAIPTVIIFKQPDLGNALIFLFIYLAMLLFSPLPKKYFIYALAVLTLIVPIGWFLLKPYQRIRILGFINPSFDSQGVSYNMIQSMITVGTGNFFGRGLGLGTQSRLQFLPENHTDFAFSSMSEQFGFFGGFTVLICFAVIVYFLMKRLLKYVLKNDEDTRSAYLYVLGFMTYFVSQTVVNIGMNLGLFPIAGIALPFISYGGSALVAIMIGLALIP